MNLRKSFYFTGNFIIYFGFFILLPLLSYFLVSSDNETIYKNKNLLQLVPFLLSSFVTLICGYGLRTLSYNSESMEKDLTRKDGFLLASLVWIFAGLFGSLPYIFSSINIYGITQISFEPIFTENIIVNP